MQNFYKSCKFLLALVLLALCNFSLTAQQSFKAGASFGVIASQVAGDGYGGFDKAGLFAGTFVNIYTSENWSWQMEINYAQKGSRKNPNTAQGDHDFFLMRLNYIDIPLIARVDYRDFIFEGGLYYARLINYSLQDENGEFELPEASNEFENQEFGALIGITYQLTEQLLMNWRFNNSIQEIREYDSDEEYMLNDGYFNTYLSFSIRYEFLK